MVGSPSAVMMEIWILRLLGVALGIGVKILPRLRVRLLMNGESNGGKNGKDRSSPNCGTNSMKRKNENDDQRTYCRVGRNEEDLRRR